MYKQIHALIPRCIRHFFRRSRSSDGVGAKDLCVIYSGLSKLTIKNKCGERVHVNLAKMGNPIPKNASITAISSLKECLITWILELMYDIELLINLASGQCTNLVERRRKESNKSLELISSRVHDQKHT